MPNYHYRCTECKEVTILNLSISTDPNEPRECQCSGDMKRIIASTPPAHGFKVWAGDWFAKEYGHDIGEGAMKRVEARKEYERELDKLKRDGINITHKSRQVGGKDRIRIKDDK